MRKAQWRKLHRVTAPIMMLPLLLTLITGSLFQWAMLNDKANDFLWLLELHKCHFGSINLEQVYPFLNALGLLILVVTGITMWFSGSRRRIQRH